MKIYKPSGRAEEYSPLALNYFNGCTHDCKYCYVDRIEQKSHKHTSRSVCSPPDSYGFDELELSARQFQGCDKQILLSFTSDPYCDMPPEYTREVLEILNKYEHKVSILTKGGSRVMRDMDIFKKFVSNDLFSTDTPRISVGGSLTFDNPADSLTWEPGAALPADRIESLRRLSAEGIRTWVSFEPIMYPEQSLNLLRQVSGFVHHVRIGKINGYNNWDKKVDWYDFLKQSVDICRKTKLPFYIKDDLAIFKGDIYLSDQERNSCLLNL